MCRIKDINTNCLKQFTAHWECLENNNQNLWECRKPEMALNSCVFDKLVCFPPLVSLVHCAVCNVHANPRQGLKKSIPGAPENEVPVHLRPKQLYAQFPGPQY